MQTYSKTERISYFVILSFFIALFLIFINITRTISKNNDISDLLTELRLADKDFDIKFRNSQKEFSYEQINTHIIKIKNISKRLEEEIKYSTLLNNKYKDLKQSFDKKYKINQNNISDLQINNKDMESLNETIDNKFNDFKNTIKAKSTQNREVEEYIEFFLILIFLIVFTALFFLLNKEKKLRSNFQAILEAVENSDNTVVITNEKQEIIYANETFEKNTGYTKSEAIGKKPNILKSGLQDDDFYKTLQETINSGKKWQGEFINKRKNGTLFFEKASIAPVIQKNNIVAFVAIKLDVTDYKNQQIELQKLNSTLEQRVKSEIEKNIEKEKTFLQNSKLIAMGEMISMVAHQWRQPLNNVGILVQDLDEAFLNNELNKEYIHNSVEEIMNQIYYMSKTIDDFRNFIKPNKDKSYFNLLSIIKELIKLVSPQLKSSNIKVTIIEKSAQISEIFGFRNDLTQALLNIINNAKDAIVEKRLNNDGLITIEIEQIENIIIIKILDNGGGIPDEIFAKVTEPYFSTKSKNGSGLGLYMTKSIIEEKLNGSIVFANHAEGLCVTITILI